MASTNVIVTSAGDSGVGTLRDAVQTAAMNTLITFGNSTKALREKDQRLFTRISFVLL